MDKQVVDKLEREIEEAIADMICRLGFRGLPLLPPHRTMHPMANAGVAVYEAAVDNHGEQPQPARLPTT